jgi:hypothetical protein
LESFNKNKTDFVRQFITVDETWIHHYTPESKQQSKQWTEAAGYSAPKNTSSFHQQESSWHLCFGMLKAFFIDNLENSKTITGNIIPIF